MTRSVAADRRAIVAAVTLGVGLSGFFDGILLHQVLQWHHLLSLVPGAAFRDIGTQILADGLFHVAMYLVTATGIWLLWRRRDSLGDYRTVVGGALVGFGLWNLVDVGFFHWVLGIHRIRINVPDPMAYDLSWFIFLGMAPTIAGWLMLRPRTTLRGGGPGSAAALSILALIAAPMAAVPQTSSNVGVAFFPPGSSPAVAVNAAMAADAGILWIDPAGRMIAVSLREPNTASSLYRAGALLVTRSPALAGCTAAVRI